MNRRQFLLASGAATAASSLRGAATATILYGDRAVVLDDVRTQADDLWVRSEHLPRINEFEVKPEGACRADMCIPIPASLRQGPWFNLTGFAHKLGQVFVADSGVWSFGEIPVLRSAFVNSRVAPDFAVPDRTGRIEHLKDFSGKKILVFTWASW